MSGTLGESVVAIRQSSSLPDDRVSLTDNAGSMKMKGSVPVA